MTLVLLGEMSLALLTATDEEEPQEETPEEDAVERWPGC